MFFIFEKRSKDKDRDQPNFIFFSSSSSSPLRQISLLICKFRRTRTKTAPKKAMPGTDLISNRAEPVKPPREDLDENYEICTEGAATGQSTCVPAAKMLGLADDGSIDGFPLSQQQLEVEGSDADEGNWDRLDTDEEDSDWEAEAYTFGYCVSCVDNQVCKVCGHKDGFPLNWDKCARSVCLVCGTYGKHRTLDCPNEEGRCKYYERQLMRYEDEIKNKKKWVVDVALQERIRQYVPPSFH